MICINSLKCYEYLILAGVMMNYKKQVLIIRIKANM